MSSDILKCTFSVFCSLRALDYDGYADMNAYDGDAADRGDRIGVLLPLARDAPLIVWIDVRSIGGTSFFPVNTPFSGRSHVRQ